MKLTCLALVLMAGMAFVMAGCSDNPTQPVSPTDKSVVVPRPLAKQFETPFYGTMWQNVGDPGFIVDTGVVNHADGKSTFKGVQQRVLCAATFPAGATDLFSGSAIVTMDGWADFYAGEGVFYGKLDLTPTNGGGGMWKLSWHAKGTIGPLPESVQPMLGPIGWILPLQEEGPGVGGTLTGKHIFMDNNIYCTPDLLIFIGVYSGSVKSH